MVSAHARARPIKTIFVADKLKLFVKKVFSRRTIHEGLHELQDSYLSSKPHVEGELFPLARAPLGYSTERAPLGGQILPPA